MNNKNTWNLNSASVIKNVFLICLGLEILLVVLDVFLNWIELIDSSSLQRIFNLAREQSLGTWFSILQSAMAGWVLFLIFLAAPQQKSSCGWLILSAFFVYLSADDAAKIHERIGSFLDREAASLFGGGAFQFIGTWFEKYPSYSWQLVFAPIFLGMGGYSLYFLWNRLPSPQTRRLLIFSFVCWGIALGIDYVEGLETPFKNLAAFLNFRSYTVSHFFLIWEEFLEMFGMTLFLVLFLKILFNSLENKTLSIE